MIKIGKLIILYALLVFSSLAQSAVVSVTATVDTNQVFLGDIVVYTISVSSSKGVSVEKPRLPNFSGNFQLMGQSQASETRSSFVNGDFQIQRAQKYKYQLAPTKKGSFKLKPSRVVVNGKAYLTKSINIKVLKRGPGSQAQRQGRPRQQFGANPFDSMDDVFSQLLNRRSQMPRTRTINEKDAFFIESVVDKKRAYVGEQIVVSYYLYSKGQIRDIDTLKYPSLKGFWKEDIEVASRLNFKREVINGVVYLKALLASYALFPINPGEALIDPYEAKCTVIQNGGFGFGSRPLVSTQKSAPIKVQIQPLPEPKPESFTGGVGNFKVSARLAANTVPANEPVSLKLQFEGIGNAKRIDLPKFDWPKSVEVYDEMSESKFNKTGSSYKAYEILLVPKVEGELILPSRTFSFFNPESKSYYQREVPELHMTVTPGTQTNLIPSVATEQGASSGGAKDLGPRLPELALNYESRVHSFSVYGLYFWLALALGGIILLSLRAKKLLFASSGLSSAQVLKGRFSRIDKALASGDMRQLGVEAMNTIYFALGETSPDGGAAVNLSKLFRKVSPSVRRELEQPIRKSITTFETLSFAPDDLLKSVTKNKALKTEVRELKKLLNRVIQLGVGSEEV